MIFLRSILVGLLLALAIGFSGCQGNNSDAPVEAPDNTLPPIELNATNEAASLSFVNGSTISVVSSGETRDIYIRAFNSSGTLDTEGEITIQYPNKNIDDGIDVGAFSPNTATITNGIAHFVYTAPADLQGRVDAGDTFTEFNFFSTTNALVTTMLHVDYDPGSDITATPPVLETLVLSESTINIRQSEELKDLTLFAYTDQNTLNINVGVVAQVEDTAIGKDIGIFPATLSVVNGRVNFMYTGPSDLLATSGQIASSVITFYDEENPGITALLTINFIPDTPILSVENSSIELTENAQTETVTILAFDSNNQAFNTGTVIVEYPTDIADGTVSGGSFSQNEASIVNGRATFSFTGPADLESMSEQIFTFKYKENPVVTSSLTVTYEKKEAEVILNITEKTITTNSETVSIDVGVIDEKGNPYTEGDVKIVYPSDLRDGRDVGSFENLSVTVVNGQASFTYTAPKNLDSNTSDLVFGFYHETNPSRAKDYTIKIVPEPGQIVLEGYKLESSILDGNLTLNLESSEILSFYLRTDSDVLINDSNITSMSVTLLNPDLGELADTSGNRGDTLTILDKNSVNLNLETGTISGLLPIRVVVGFVDANGDTQTITEVFNVVILSGPPTAVSISYASTSHDPDYAKFQENLVVTVTDKYFNRVNTNPAITTALIVGYADDAGTRIFHEPVGSKGSIDPATDVFTADNGVNFSSVDENNDILMTYGVGYKYAASGFWTFTTPSGSDLTLLADYVSTNGVEDELGFAVGRNQRDDTCRIGEAWIGNIVTADGLNQIDDSGMARLTLNYDYYLTGKDVMIGVNLVGYTASTGIISKVGEAKKHTLRSTGLESSMVNLAKGFSGIVRLPVEITDAPEWLRNSNFGFTFSVNDAVSINGWSRSSSDDNCTESNGVAYVDANVTVDPDKAGTIQLVNILVGNEF